MKKRALALLLGLILAFGLAACGSTPASEPAEADTAAEEAVETEAAPEEAVEAAPSEAPQGSVVTVDGTTVTIKGSDEGTEISKKELDKHPVFTCEDVAYTVETGPMIFTINWFQVSSITIHDKSLCDLIGIEKDQEIACVTINATSENTAEEETDFYPDQGTIVTNTKEQVTASMIFSDEVGGFFYGPVIKEGVIAFLCPRSKADEITHVTFRCDAPCDTSLASLGDPVVIDFDLQP